MCMTMFFQFPD